MSRANRSIKAALKAVLVPHLKAEGFTGEFPNFMRREGDMLHLLSVQFDKWGGGFFLELAPHPAGDLTMSWGEVVREAELTTAHTPVVTRARLQATGSSSSMNDMWFRFEGLSDTQCESLAQQVVDLFPEVNAWLRDRTVGPHLSVMEP